MKISKFAAVIDRIVDGKKAVLLVGDEHKQLIVSLEDLPEGSKEGLWLQIELENNKLITAKLDGERTEDMKKRISAKRALLLKRKRR